MLKRNVSVVLDIEERDAVDVSHGHPEQPIPASPSHIGERNDRVRNASSIACLCQETVNISTQRW